MHSGNMISPEWTYAKNKQRAQGGTLEEYALEFHRLMDRSYNILVERGLVKDHKQVSLVELGIVDKANVPVELPIEAMNVYSILNSSFLEDKSEIERAYGFEAPALENRLNELVGEEYAAISREIKRYCRE
jgi:hypothetical protein